MCKFSEAPPPPPPFAVPSLTPAHFDPFRKLVGRIDESGDGKLSKEEIVSWLEKVEDHTYKAEADDLFVKEDTDQDGFITFEEYWRNSEDEGVC